MTSELSEADMKRPIEQILKPHWDENAKTLADHLQAEASARGVSVDEVNTYGPVARSASHSGSA